MRIALDARPIFNPRNDDNQRGAWLTQMYSHLHDARPDWQFMAYHRPVEDDAPLKFTPNCFTRRPINFLGDRMQAWSRWRLPLAARRDQVDVVHGTLLHNPSVRGVPTIVSVDHLLPVESPKNFSAKEVTTFEHRVTSVSRLADHLVVPTEHLRTQLIIRFNAEPSRISVIAPGVNPHVQFVAQTHWHPVMQRYGIDKPFVLHYGQDTSLRNTRRLIEAWAMADSRIRQRLQLVIVGLNDDSGQDLVGIVNRLGLSQSVRLMREFAEPGDLSTLLSAADITAMPAKAVGFPAFLLEAWKAKSAVIAGRVSGMETIAGDAATLIDPADPCAIARALKRLVVDARFRGQLITQGQQQLEKFTWHGAAERFAQVAERLANVPAQTLDDSNSQRKAA